MAIEISCSKCGSEFRVKDEAAGKVFKCKSCGASIPIPHPDEDDFDVPDELPPPRRRSRAEVDDDDDERPKRRKKKRSSAGGKTLGPAIGLYITGGLWFLWTMVTAVMAFLNPQMRPKAPPGANEAFVAGQMGGFYAVTIGLPLIALFIVAGAFCLHMRRMYAMAMLACILASIPCCSPAFILGMPFGIWGIVVLANEDVKRSFE